MDGYPKLQKKFIPSEDLPSPEEFEANVVEETKAHAEYEKTALHRTHVRQ